jgi:hypothetical protein
MLLRLNFDSVSVGLVLGVGREYMCLFRWFVFGFGFKAMSVD